MPPKLSAPTEFVPSTSVIHLSETFFPGDVLMDAALLPGEVIRTLSPVERGMFEDLGWTTAPEPRGATPVALAALGILGLRRRR